jgi:ketosteroid isomerase-like protein
MSDANKRIVLELMENLSDGRWDAAFDALTDDAVWWVPPMPQPLTKAQFRAVCLQAHRIYKGKPKTIPKRITAEEDRVALEAESDADLINGNHYHNHYHYLFVLRGGKVCEAKEYMDTKHAAEAFGDLLPAGKGSGA